MATQQRLDAFMSPRHTADKRNRETTPPSQKTHQSPENKSYRPNTKLVDTNSAEDKKRKTRGRKALSDTSGKTPMDTKEVITPQRSHTENVERSIVTIKKKKTKKRLQETKSKSIKESPGTTGTVRMTKEFRSPARDQMGLLLR